MKNANILLYEDIAGYPPLYRYVEAAIKRLDLPYVDVGDAQGWLKDRLLRGTDDGKAWDLVIIAAENRDAIQGEYFETLEKILDQGDTAVIMESWYLDAIAEGTAKPILMKCGVDVYPYPPGSRSPQELIIFPVDRNHPILNNPIPITEFKIADYWSYEDMGSLMYPNGKGDAEFILVRDDQKPAENGLLAICMDQYLLLMTMSTHNYMDESVVPLWMNMIDFILRSHFTGS